MRTVQSLLDDVGRVLGPNEGCRALVPVLEVIVDVRHESPDGVERASSDGLASEDSEPGFNHVQPRCSLGSEVEVDTGVLCEPVQDGWCGVGGGVIEDDVEFSLPIALLEMLEETQEVGTGVRGATLTNDFAADDLEGGIEARDAGATVVMSLPCGKPRPHRQHGLGSLEGLDLGFLVKAQDDGVCRWVQIEADDVVDLLFGLRISDELEALKAMGLEIVGFPDAMDRHVGDPSLSSHLPSGPLSETFIGLFQGQRDDLCSLASLERRGAARARLLEDPRDSIAMHTLADAADLDRAVPATLSDLRPRDVIHHQQDRPCPAAEPCRSGRGADELLELIAVLGGEVERLGLSAHGTGRSHEQ
jgi:hypothetical protein